MSRDSFSICQECRIYQDNTPCVNAASVDYCSTVEEFDRLVAPTLAAGRKLSPNAMNVRAFLSEHAAHGDGVTYWSSDWFYDEDPTDGLKLVAHKHHDPPCCDLTDEGNVT